MALYRRACRIAETKLSEWDHMTEIRKELERLIALNYRAYAAKCMRCSVEVG